MKVVFAAFSPHPPILLPNVAPEEERGKVKKTIGALENLGKKLELAKPDTIIISSPHQDWGFNVPLYFLAKNFKGEIKKYLMGLSEPQLYFQEGKKLAEELKEQFKNENIALIASGDMSHCLKETGPYGFHPDGPKYDAALINYLKNKDIKNFLKLDEYFPKAAECGLRSFSFLLGILEGLKLNWQAKILSYEGPFGVGYLVVEFKF